MKPEWIINDLILNSSNEGDIVLDPFAGSGTTGATALSVNGSFVGIDMDKKFYDIACERLNL